MCIFTASHVSRRVVDIERREVAGVAAARVLAAKRRAVKAAKRPAEDTSSLVERQSFDPTLDPITAFIAYQKTPCTSTTTCVAAGRTVCSKSDLIGSDGLLLLSSIRK
jgi:hypothetical protein